MSRFPSAISEGSPSPFRGQRMAIDPRERWQQSLEAPLHPPPCMVQSQAVRTSFAATNARSAPG